MLREFHRVLKPRGKLVLVENVKFPIGPPRVDAEELQGLVEGSGFKLQERLRSRVSAIMAFVKAG